MAKRYKYKLYGAILGDLVGQPFEFGSYDKPIQLHNPDSVITDDTLMTLATAHSIMDGYTPEQAYKEIGRKYTGDHYGKGFKEWLKTPMLTTNDSYGNGCIMRISPYMYIGNSLPDIMESVLCSHRNTLSIQSALKLYEAYKGQLNPGNAHILNRKRFKVEADATIDLVLRYYEVNPGLGTHSQILGITSLKGDTDTNASIIGELSNYHSQDLTKEDADYVESKLDPYLLRILKRFNNIV